MNYQEFITNIRENIALRVEAGTVLQIQSIVKNNGTGYDGLIMMRPNLNISPTIYLNPYYHRFLEGVSLEDIYNDILEVYYNHLPEESFDVTRYTDFEKVRDNIVYRLVNYERNADLLKQVPFVPFLDLAIIFYCQLEASENQQASILVYNHHMEQWGQDTASLMEHAKCNTPRLFPWQLEDMQKYIRELHPNCISPKELPENTMYILTNKYRNYGAAVLLYDDLIRKLAMKLHSDLVIIPSSIHELLLIPANSRQTLSYCDDMVRTVNETQVADDEILADHAYYYSLDDCQITFRSPQPLAQ